MGRPKELSRDRLLEAAQSIIAQSSPATLSFGILAAVAGVPKSSVQAIFRSKQELLDGMAGAGDRSEVATQWGSERVGDLSARTGEEARLRLAFLASEGLFFLRHVLQFPVSDTLWREIFGDIEAMIGEAGLPPQ